MSTSIANDAAPATAGAAEDTLVLIGRVMIASLFVPEGFGKLTGFADVVAYISAVGLPLPALGAVIAIVVEVGLGLLFLVGYRTRIVSIILAVFTVVTAVIFHNYWAMPTDKAYVNHLMFFKNIAVAGGLLAIAAFGAGRFSIDRK